MKTKTRNFILDRRLIIADLITVGICLSQSKRLLEMAERIDFSRPEQEWMQKDDKEAAQGIASRAAYVASGMAEQIAEDLFNASQAKDDFISKESHTRPDAYEVRECWFED